MDNASMKNLKFDRRLARRRGWVDSAELAGVIDALPDVADKAEVVRDEESAADDGPPASPEADA